MVSKRIALLHIVVASLLMSAVTAAKAEAELVIENHFPVKGESVGIRVLDEAGNPVSGATVEVVYRPGSSVQKTEVVGSSTAGSVQWTPAEAGIATITAKWAADQGEATTTANVSVKFSGPPLDGILIMIIAGLLLVVGSVIRVLNLLRVPATH
jgi:hypothetical protein